MFDNKNEREKKKMETYICAKCKSVIEVEDLERVKGEWEDGYYKGDEYVCPHCGSTEYYEAVQCPICGEYVAEEESYDGYCENCVEKAATPENLVKWCDDGNYKESVEINESIVDMCKALKIDIEAVLKAVIFENAYKDRLEAYSKMSAKDEIDTEYFMRWFTERG